MGYHSENVADRCDNNRSWCCWMLSRIFLVETRKKNNPFRLNTFNLERDKSEPDRIVGELLQPGGVISLRKLGLSRMLLFNS